MKKMILRSVRVDSDELGHYAYFFLQALELPPPPSIDRAGKMMRLVVGFAANVFIGPSLWGLVVRYVRER